MTGRTRTLTWLLVLATTLVAPGAAAAAVTATESGGLIAITGTAGDDATALSDDGESVRIKDATAGAGCSQSGADALCPRERRTVTAALDAGNDSLGNSSAVPVTVDGGAGNDKLSGGPGADILRGGAGDDGLDGGAGDDTIVGGPGTDGQAGGDGTDTISFAEDTAGVIANLADGSIPADFENVLGSPFNDTIVGKAGSNRLDGAAGTDTVSYAGRASGFRIDLAAGTAGPEGATAEDTLAGFENAIGTAAADTLIGTPAANLLQGGDGNDTLRGGLGADSLLGAGGVDIVDFDHLAPAGSAAEVGITHTLGGLATGNTENDVTIDIENMSGSKRADVLTGTAGPNEILGGDGDDRIAPGAGVDRTSGGAGADTLDYSGSSVPIHAKLANVGGLKVTEFAATVTTDTMADQFENLIGTPLADVLVGSTQANRLAAGAGNDVVDGGNGDDTLEGGAGNDRFGKVAASVATTVQAAQVAVGNASNDGEDTVLAGAGNDDVNVRDQQFDARVDCGIGTDIARQDLPDDDGDLDIDNCETVETIAADQRAMTVIRAVRRLSGGRIRLTISCPPRSRVACNGTAAVVARASARPRRGTRYRIRKGGRARVTVTRSGRYVVLTERDQRGRVRRLVRRIG